MIVKRGEIWMADLNPIRGSEQAGIRPGLVLQNDAINKVTTTVLSIPLTTNLRRAVLPSCVQLAAGEGGLPGDSVVLGHQLRVLDKSRLLRRLGSVSANSLAAIENVVLFALGMT